MPDELCKTQPILNNAPLLERLPKRDVDGKHLADFMMLIPKLREQPSHLLNL